MAGLLQSGHNFDDHTPHEESFEHVFRPQETLGPSTDHPCDITLIAKDGKELKAHKDILSKASPFFEKLLNSGMKESKVGVVRLEMFSESVIAATLEFLYVGEVEISTLEVAVDLIVVADYFILPKLKNLAKEFLVDEITLNILNCVSAYRYAEIYQIDELACKARKFILANFMTFMQTENFFNMPSNEVELWISSDEIEVSAEEDVFKIILAWIDRDKSERKKYFAELFRHVRLVYVSRDFLCRDVVTNYLVTDNEDCMSLVRDVMTLKDSKNYHNVFVPPRESLKTSVLIVYKEDHILGYFPREKKLCKLGFQDPLYERCLHPCNGKLYYICQSLKQLQCYDPFSNSWKVLAYKETRNLEQIIVRNEDGMYALVSKPVEFTNAKVELYLTKYIPDTNSWEDVSSLKFGMEDLTFQERMCIVAKDSLMYFIGGRRRNSTLVLKDVYKYDLCKDQGEKLADMRLKRQSASGASAYGKLFVAGGFDQQEMYANTCEVYVEATNEWQFIAGLYMSSTDLPRIFSVDDNLYVLAAEHHSDSPGIKVECYDPAKDEWNEKIEIPIRVNAAETRWFRSYYVFIDACSMRIFNGLLSNFKVQTNASFSADKDDEVETAQKVGKRKCSVM